MRQSTVQTTVWVCLLIGASVEPLSAADHVLRHEIEFFSQSSGGEATGCGMNFKYEFKYHTYYDRQIVGASGSLTYLFEDGRLYSLFKIWGVDLPSGPAPGIPRNFIVYEASLRVDGKLLRPAQYKCDESYGYCGTFELKDSSEVFAAMKAKQPIELIFNRRQDGPNYNFLFVDEPGADQDGEKFDRDRSAYYDCMSAIFSRAQAKLPSTKTAP